MEPFAFGRALVTSMRRFFMNFLDLVADFGVENV